MMRKLYQVHGGREAAVVTAYAEAEEAGAVARVRNENSVESETYAKALWRDGINKGWLP
jgi:hypothetical protein